MAHAALSRPLTFEEYRQNVGSTLPAFRYALHWSAHHLGNWYSPLASASMLIAVIFYFGDSNHRTMQRHYQAWQVINTSQGKGGSGGRIDALQELAKDKVSLTGVDLSEAFLQGVRLDHAMLVRANFHNADLRSSEIASANLSYADLSGANLRNASLRGSKFEGADLTDADLTGADLSEANLTGVNLSGADVRDAEFRGVRWNGVVSVKNANLAGIKNAPPGFLEWAQRNGAIGARTEPEK